MYGVGQLQRDRNVNTHAVMALFWSALQRVSFGSALQPVLLECTAACVLL